ncbi:MAG: 2-C-methyl-D-erythritol 2,4-cyclodiphosphate synthase [Treponema sp.]|nr:2-C-methyl-D-erythritol 2,4-cyclodiphosphate synthase [Treponema sp.]
MIRVGLGYDKHVLTEGRKLVLGGVVIPFDKGEAGHSDGDVLLHAITDSLLGASGLGDIGSYFPPEEAKWKDADSKSLLKTCWNDVKKEGWSLVNLDCVIALEKPKFIPFRDQVCQSIADVLEVEKNQIFVKAKTGEKLGDIGQGRAVEVWCVALLER